MNGRNLECAGRLGGQLPGMRCLELVTGPGASSFALVRGISRRQFTGFPDDPVIASRQHPWSGEVPVRSPLLALVDWFERVLRHACRVE
jgi:hypothetical protein